MKELVVSEVDSQTRQEAVAALMPSIVDLMKQSGWNKSDLDCVVVGEGPGSFTGVRTGIVTGRTIAQGLQLPLLAVSLLDCYASVAELPAAILLSAGRGRYFVAGYDSAIRQSTDSTKREAADSAIPSKDVRPIEMERTHPACFDASELATGTFNTSVPPTSVSLEELGDLFAEFPVWYLDGKALSELKEAPEKLVSQREGRSLGIGAGKDAGAPRLESLPILENIATKQAQIAWDRLSLKLVEASLSEERLSEECSKLLDCGKLSGSSDSAGKSQLLRDSLLQAFPYHSVKPLYLRSPSITLKKNASEKPHGS